MSWNEYRRNYYDFARALSEARIIALIGETVLNEFPRNLPETIVGPLRARVKVILDEVEASTGEDRDLPPPKPDEDHVESLVLPTLMLFQSQHSSGVEAKPLDLPEALKAQELVMTFAHLDAFLGDCLAAACRARPEILSRGKTIEWKAVVALGSWEALLKHLRDEYVFEFTWEPVRRRIDLLAERLGLECEFPPGNLELLEHAALFRHAIVHNGSRVSRALDQDSGRMGERLLLPQAYSAAVSMAALRVGGRLFAAIAQKFFEQDPKALAGILFGSESKRNADGWGP